MAGIIHILCDQPSARWAVSNRARQHSHKRSKHSAENTGLISQTLVKTISTALILILAEWRLQMLILQMKGLGY